MIEVERIEQVVECRAVGWHIEIVLRHLRIGKVIAAAVGERPEGPVALDELNNETWSL